jgi:hypothetical protein
LKRNYLEENKATQEVNYREVEEEQIENENENEEEILESGSRPDIIAFDFYSRFQRITMPACDRFASQLPSTDTPAPPLCKRNHLKWCQTDLGAAALNFRRFQEENRKFGDIVNHDPFHRLLGADSADGVMMETLVYDGWKVAHVTDTCLFVHSPSIHSCAWQGGVWDDRDLIKISGGKCLTQEEADTILREDRNQSIEQVRVDVSSDGRVPIEFEGIKNNDVLERVRCLRRKDYKEESVLGLTQVWYSEWCVDKEDENEFRKFFYKFYPTDNAVQAAQDAAQRYAESEGGKE